MKYILSALLIAGLTIPAFHSAFAQYEREENHEFAIAPGGKVSFDTYAGSITVRTWDKPLVRVKVQIVSNGHYRGAREDVEDTRIFIANNSKRVHLETERSRDMGVSSIVALFTGHTHRPALVHYTVTMPKTATLDIDDYKSSIDVRNMLSNVSIDTYKGRTFVSNVSGHLYLDTYKGHFRVKGLTGGIDVDTYKGNGDIDFSGFLHASRLETYKGRIAVRIPSSTGFNLDADLNRRGSLESDIRFRKARNDEFRGKINGGGPMLSLETVKGTFAIRKR